MSLPFDLVSFPSPAVGLIVLQTDSLVDPEIGGLMHDVGVRSYFARIPAMPEVRTDNLSKMAATMTATAALLPPDAGIRAVAYACTSGATVIGEERVQVLVNDALPNIPVTNPLSALKAACEAFGIRRLAVVSPYVEDVNQALFTKLADVGIETPAFGSFEQAADGIVGRINPAAVLDALVEYGRGDVDAVFASCTNLRAFEIVAEAEDRIGKPVLCSNQVLSWHLLQLARHPKALDGRGRLFSESMRG